MDSRLTASLSSILHVYQGNINTFFTQAKLLVLQRVQALLGQRSGFPLNAHKTFYKILSDLYKSLLVQYNNQSGAGLYNPAKQSAEACPALICPLKAGEPLSIAPSYPKETNIMSCEVPARSPTHARAAAC